MKWWKKALIGSAIWMVILVISAFFMMQRIKREAVDLDHRDAWETQTREQTVFFFALGLAAVWGVFWIRQRRMTSWRYCAASILVLVVGLPVALLFSTPTAVGYIQLPGVIIGVVVACICVGCFFLCPRRPLVPKIVTGFLCIPTLFCALDFVAYYWLHVRHHG